MDAPMDELAGRDPIGEGLIFQYAYYASLTLSGAAFYLYLTHIFPTSSVGSVALLLAIVSLFPAFFSLGLQYGWQHFISYFIGQGKSGEVHGIIRQAIRTGLVLSAAAVIFLLASAHYISVLFFHTAAYTTLVFLLALDIPSAIMISILNGMMLGLQRFKTAGIIGMTYVVIVYGSSVVLLKASQSLNAVPIGWGIGYFIGVLMYYYELTKWPVKAQQKGIGLREVLKYSTPLYATGILSVGASYIDRLTVAFFKNLSSIGVYTLVLLIVSGVGLLSAPIGGVIFSKFSEFYAKKDNQMIREGVRISVNAASVLYIPAALGVSALAVPLLRVLGGPAYVIGSVPLAIILTVNALVIVGGPMGSALQGTRKTLIFVLSTSIALISNLVLSVLLIPSLSLTGAAIGYSSVGTVSFVVIFAYAWKSGVVKLDIRMLSRIWLSAIVMSALVYLFATVTGFSGILIPFYVIAGLVTYLLMLKATSALSETDKELLKRLIPGELGLLKAFVELL